MHNTQRNAERTVLTEKTNTHRHKCITLGMLVAFATVCTVTLG